MSHYHEQPLRDEIERLERQVSDLQRKLDKAEEEREAAEGKLLAYRRKRQKRDNLNERIIRIHRTAGDLSLA